MPTSGDMRDKLHSYHMLITGAQMHAKTNYNLQFQRTNAVKSFVVLCFWFFGKLLAFE